MRSCVVCLTAAWLSLAVTGCPDRPGSASGVSRQDCVEIVRKQNKLRSKDTGGLEIALGVTERQQVEQCLSKVTPAANRCVKQAHSAADLRSCDSLFR
jgi:hypothetical protein